MVNNQGVTRSTSLGRSKSGNSIKACTTATTTTPDVRNTSSKQENSTNLQTYLLQNAVNTTIQNMTEDDIEQKIISEFVHLNEKSKQLFNGLRDLPQYGHRNNQWQAYYGRTFDVYTKLWKYQQQYRQILEHKYNLKRWQIGEIASKIGQLYYHYYLRTSESNYLFESYSFYQAIQTRNYYSRANKEEKPDLIVKKLRFYARFIVVCLLLKKSKQVNDLTKDLSRHIDDYIKIYDPPDQLEWQLVKNEIHDYIQGDSLVNVDSAVTAKMVLSNRLDVSQVPHFGPNSMQASAKAVASSLTLQEILIVGNCQNQIKFSELSLDMFRMLQACERIPTNNVPDLDSEDSKRMVASLNVQGNIAGDPNSKKIIQRENPHKYLLYKPSFSQFLTYVSAAFKDMPAHGVMLVYLSADGCDGSALGESEPETSKGGGSGFDKAGVCTNNRREVDRDESGLNVSGKSDSSNYKEVHCIYPGDLYAYLRKPLFLIVDSANSTSFQNIPNLFGQPFIGLFSPTTLPVIFSDKQNQTGNLFTLFLTNPLFAFCTICNVNELSAEVFYRAQQLIRVIFADIAKLFYRSKSVNAVFLQASFDDFLRVFLLRYVFCHYSFRLHKGFRGTDYYPSSQPKISNDILENTSIQSIFIELATVFDANHAFVLLEE